MRTQVRVKTPSEYSFKVSLPMNSTGTEHQSNNSFNFENNSQQSDEDMAPNK